MNRNIIPYDVSNVVFLNTMSILINMRWNKVRDILITSALFDAAIRDDLFVSLPNMVSFEIKLENDLFTDIFVHAKKYSERDWHVYISIRGMESQSFLDASSTNVKQLRKAITRARELLGQSIILPTF